MVNLLGNYDFEKGNCISNEKFYLTNLPSNFAGGIMRARTALVLFMLLLINAAFAVLTIDNSNDEMLKITYKSGEFEINETDLFSVIKEDDLYRKDTVGLPDIPYYEFNVAVPQYGNINLSYSVHRTESLILNLPLQPIPEIKRGKETDEYQYAIIPEYRTAINQIEVVKGEYEEFRHSAFVPVRIYPFGYNPGKKELEVADEIEITITISGNTKAIRQLSEKDGNIISELVVNPASALKWKTGRTRETVNYTDFTKSDYWYRFSVRDQGLATISYSDLSELPLQDIDPRSIRIMTNGGKLLYNNSEEQGSEFVEIPIIVEGEDDGVFNQNDRIILYVEGRDLRRKNTAISQSLFRNPYSDETVYWLTFEGDFPTAPLRISSLPEYYQEDVQRTISQYPFTFRKEDERYRRSQWGFEWYDYLMAGSSTQTYNFDIPAIDVAPEQGVYSRFELSAVDSNTDDYGESHSMDILLNGSVIYNAIWTGPSAKFVSTSNYTPQSGTNEVGLRVNRTSSNDILLDYIQITYDRLLKKKSSSQYKLSIRDLDENIITQFNFTKESNSPLYVFQVDDFNQIWKINPTIDGSSFSFIADGKKVEGEYSQPTEYLIGQDSDLLAINNINRYYPSDLPAASQSIDYIIITPQEFISQANRLASIYESTRSLNCEVLTLSQIFDWFNAGMPDPGALKLYFEYLYDVNPAADSMAVVLLGSGTYDWRNNSGQAASK
ncbi:MAG: hypothetical protein JXR56_00950, partial [Candidatus Cloacimonetes bacterium]|nr:hypothetical protein [Candidatus Cloacimonadota bacterium]